MTARLLRSGAFGDNRSRRAAGSALGPVGGRPAPPAVVAESHLSRVSPLTALIHDHTWTLRETEYDDCGLTLNRFECGCGGVSYGQNPHR